MNTIARAKYVISLFWHNDIGKLNQHRRDYLCCLAFSHFIRMWKQKCFIHQHYHYRATAHRNCMQWHGRRANICNIYLIHCSNKPTKRNQAQNISTYKYWISWLFHWTWIRNATQSVKWLHYNCGFGFCSSRLRLNLLCSNQNVLYFHGEGLCARRKTHLLCHCCDLIWLAKPVESHKWTKTKSK